MGQPYRSNSGYTEGAVSAPPLAGFRSSSIATTGNVPIDQADRWMSRTPAVAPPPSPANVRALGVGVVVPGVVVGGGGSGGVGVFVAVVVVAAVAAIACFFRFLRVGVDARCEFRFARRHALSSIPAHLLFIYRDIHCSSAIFLCALLL